MGELLKQYDGRTNNYGNQNVRYNADDNSIATTQKEVAGQAGISEGQKRTAINLANVPINDFNEQIESETPPTVTKLAKQGVVKNEFLNSQKPEGFTEAMYIRGDISRLYDKMQKYDPLFILGGMSKDDIDNTKLYINHIEAWFDTFIINIKE